MNEKLKGKLSDLNANYLYSTGIKFKHFFCPILYEDYDGELCKAHIINKALPNTSRAWTIQRKDVDSFYGSNFESDFIKIKYKNKDSFENSLIDSHINKSLRPTIYCDNIPIDYFFSKNKSADNYCQAIFENNNKNIPFFIKMDEHLLEDSISKKWELAIEKDLRIPAFVSFLKAAHLTLFELLGYRYVFSKNSYFLGYSILGKFFFRK